MEFSISPQMQKTLADIQQFMEREVYPLEAEVAANGETLSAVLDDLDSNYAGIKGRIVDEQGDLRRFVNVYVGNDDVRFLENLETATPEGTQISVIPAVAGG